MRFIAAVFVSACAVGVQAEITEADLFMFGDMEKYKADVVPMLNRLARDNAACRQRIDPRTAGLSKEKSVPGDPSFFVQCGDREKPDVVRFTLKEARTLGALTPAAEPDMDAALAAVISEKRVLDATWSSPSDRILVAAVQDDGSRRDGFAEYLCLVLAEHGVRGGMVFISETLDLSGDFFGISKCSE